VEDSGIAVSAPESPYTFTFGRPKRVGLDLKFRFLGRIQTVADPFGFGGYVQDGIL
jgi:hypothetical protein